MRPRPLQASTNIIHTKTLRNNLDNLKLSVNQNKQNLIEPAIEKTTKSLKTNQTDLKKTSKNKSTISATPAKKTDENDIDDVEVFAKQPYNPLDHVQPLDDALHQKLSKLDLADDGYSKVQSDGIDENDIEAFAKDPYDPLDYVEPLDDKLYERLLNMEFADDGLGKFESDEPFDWD